MQLASLQALHSRAPLERVPPLFQAQLFKNLLPGAGPQGCRGSPCWLLLREGCPVGDQQETGGAAGLSLPAGVR